MIRGFSSKQRQQLVTGLILALCLVGCNRATSDSSTLSESRPKVVATTTILADLTQEIAGDSVQLTGILKPDANPHTYQPTAADSQNLTDASLIIYNGYGLEPGLSRVINQPEKKARKLAAAEGTPALKVTNSAGKTPDPHVWGDARNTIRIALAIRDALIDLSPINRDKLTQNTNHLREELEQLDEWVRDQINTVPLEKRKLLVTHNAFQYYGKTYDLASINVLNGVNPEKPANPQTIKKLADSVSNLDVSAIFPDPTNTAIVAKVAKAANLKLAPQPLYTDSLGAQGSRGDTYVKMMVANTTTIVQALGGKVTPFKPKTTE
jgi:manganese/iron transport system substrate-binding protein